MDPKFQSSFIPKGPVATGSPLTESYGRTHTTLFAFISTTVFVISVVLAVGIFGYDRYLLAHIGTLGNDLTAAKQSLQPDTINALVRANQRILSTKTLLSQHVALSPFFDYLETATLKNVRFTQFLYETTDKGIQVTMHGMARSYTDVALQSDAFNKAGFIIGPVFSDLNLDAKGNVIFAFRATLDPSIVSYKKRLEGQPVATGTLPQQTIATSTPVLTASTTLKTTTAQKTATSTTLKLTSTTTSKTSTSTAH
jgi:hypothetical protein